MTVVGAPFFVQKTLLAKKSTKLGLSSQETREILRSSGKLNSWGGLVTAYYPSTEAQMNRDSIVIVDAPPGTSCPVVDAIKGSDVCLLVTEPTPFGLHDLTLAVELVSKLELPAGVIINQADIGDDKVERTASEKDCRY